MTNSAVPHIRIDDLDFSEVDHQAVCTIDIDGMTVTVYAGRNHDFATDNAFISLGVSEDGHLDGEEPGLYYVMPDRG
jgi:hypothetical protein